MHALCASPAYSREKSPISAVAYQSRQATAPDPLAAKLSYMRHESCPPVPVAHTEYPFSRFIYLLQIYEGDEEDFDDINYATFAVLLKVAFSVGVSNQFKEMTLNLIQIENTFNPI